VSPNGHPEVEMPLKLCWDGISVQLITGSIDD